MRITVKQLRQVIREEVTRARLTETKWIAQVDFGGGGTEEIEVEATSEREARMEIESQLQDPEMWQPGGKIVNGPEKVTGGMSISHMR